MQKLSKSEARTVDTTDRTVTDFSKPWGVLNTRVAASVASFSRGSAGLKMNNRTNGATDCKRYLGV